MKFMEFIKLDHDSLKNIVDTQLIKFIPNIQGVDDNAKKQSLENFLKTNAVINTKIDGIIDKIENAVDVGKIFILNAAIGLIPIPEIEFINDIINAIHMAKIYKKHLDEIKTIASTIATGLGPAGLSSAGLSSAALGLPAGLSLPGLGPAGPTAAALSLPGLSLDPAAAAAKAAAAAAKAAAATKAAALAALPAAALSAANAANAANAIRGGTQLYKRKLYKKRVTKSKKKLYKKRVTKSKRHM